MPAFPVEVIDEMPAFPTNQVASTMAFQKIDLKIYTPLYILRVSPGDF